MLMPDTPDKPTAAPKQPQPKTPEQEKPKKRFLARPVSAVQSWVSWDALKDNTTYVKDSTRGLFSVEKPRRQETFEEAVARLNLTESDILDRQKSFLRIAMVIGTLGILTLFYTLYLLWNASFGSSALALTVTLLCIATACRYHFWYFQTKNRKLGCTIREWLDAKVSGGQ